MPTPTVSRGDRVLVLLNLRARRASEAARAALRRALPLAEIVSSASLEEARSSLTRATRDGYRLVLSGGGDGTLVGLLNLLLEDARDQGAPGLGQVALPPIGVLRLGTGNGVANVLGAQSLSRTLRGIRDLPLPPPTRRFDLVEVDGVRSPFAGAGWDARIQNDFAAHRRAYQGRPLDRLTRGWLMHGLSGYMFALATRTIPEEYALLRRQGQAEVEVINTGPPPFTVDDGGRLTPWQGDPVRLYAGPVSVASCSTTEEWGFGFRSHPFARLCPGWLSLRIYSPPVLTAVANMGRLWRGHHPQPGMMDWFVKSVCFRFSRPMPFQIGGDPVGLREEVHLRLADERMDCVDWRAARRA